MRSVLFNDVIDNKFGHLGSESFNHKITKNKNLVNLMASNPMILSFDTKHEYKENENFNGRGFTMVGKNIKNSLPEINFPKKKILANDSFKTLSKNQKFSRITFDFAIKLKIMNKKIKKSKSPTIKNNIIDTNSTLSGWENTP